MKEINFIEVGFENFCLYTDLTIFEFKNGTITLVTGPNGSGKSSIYNAVHFSLYGVTSSGLRGEEVVNNRVGKDTTVYTIFRVQDDKYTVRRYVKHSKEGDSVYLYKNDVLVKKGHREVVPEIENIILPQKLFTNTLFFGQKVKTFFTDLTDSEQKDIFRKVLQLDNYTDYYDFTNEKLKVLSSQLNTLENNITVNLKLSEDTHSQITKLKEDKILFHVNKNKRIKELDDEILNAISELTDIEKFKSLLSESENKLLSFRNEEVTINTNINNLTNEKDSKIKELKLMKGSKESQIYVSYGEQKAKIEKEKTDSILNATELSQSIVLDLERLISETSSRLLVLQKSLNEASKKKKDIEGNILEINSNLDKEVAICYACGQEVGKDEREKLRNKVKEKEKEVESIDLEIRGYTDEFKSIQSQNTDSKTKLSKLNQQLQNEKIKINEIFDKKLSDLDNKLEEMLNKIKDLFESKLGEITRYFSEKSSEVNKSLFSVQENIRQVESDYLKYKKEIEKIEDKKLAIRKLEVELEEIKNREFTSDIVDRIIEKFKNLEEEKLKLNSEKEETLKSINAYDFWKTGFSMGGIPSMLIDEAIPFMNERIAYYLDQIGSRYQVSFDTINETKSGEFRDKIKINILDTVTKANSRKQLSGGQTRIIDIATIFTLRDLQSRVQDMKINIILLDEIFDSLDEGNISYVSTMLRKMVNDQSINIISHRNIDQIESDIIYRTI